MEHSPRPGRVAEQKQVFRRVDGASQQRVTVADGCAAHGEFGEFGRGVDAAASARVAGGDIEGLGDESGTLERTQRRVPSVLLRIAHRGRKLFVEAATIDGREVRVRDRRDQRMGEMNTLIIELEKSGPRRLGEGSRRRFGIVHGRRDGGDRRPGQGRGDQKQPTCLLGQAP